MALTTELLNRIEELKHTTYSTLCTLQKETSPMIKYIYLNPQFEYWYDGYKYNIWENDNIAFACNELPWCYDNNLKNTVFTDTLDNLIENDIMWPMLFFMGDGYVVPWSQITVLKDYDYSYLKIEGINNNDVTSASIILFPLGSKKIRYGEDNDYLVGTNIKGFYFDSDGYFTTQPEFTDLSVRLEILDDNILFDQVDFSTYKDTNAMIGYQTLESGYNPTVDNIIAFSTDGALITNLTEYIGDYWNGTYGSFILKNKTFEDVTLGTGIFMYNTSHSKSSSHLYIREDIRPKTFIQNQMGTVVIDESDESGAWLSYMKDIVEPFDFEYTWGKNYTTNTNNAAQYISRYDYSLWNQVFIDSSPIKSFTYTGAEFKAMADDTSYMHWSRRHTTLIEDMVIVFVNSKIYDNMIDVSYVNNTINIPVFGIEDDDHVEIVMFTKCNNNILDIVVNENEPVYIHPEYNLNDCYIMAEDHPDMSYPDTPTSDEHRRQYIVDVHHWTADEDSNYSITFEYDYYYGKSLKIVPKNQFRYYRFKYVQDQFKIPLPTQFNYCHDSDRYLIFVNGKKIDRTEYAITFMNKYRPFDELILYLSTILDEGDYVDIFYIPELITERYSLDQLTDRGYLYLEEPNSYPKLYSLSKYTTMVFVNGLKVNPMDIIDIDMNAMIVNTGLNNIYNVSVMEFMSGTLEVAKFLYGLNEADPLYGDKNYEPGAGNEQDLYPIEGTGYGGDKIYESLGASNTEEEDINTNTVWDKWKQIIETVIADFGGDDGFETLEKIYGELPVIDASAIEEDYKNNYAGKRSILYDVVVDYYLKRSGATTGSSFVYDFEPEYWYPTTNSELIDGWIYFVDSDGETYFAQDEETLYVQAIDEDNLSIVKYITLYPDHDKLLDYYINDNEATEEHVLEGQRFYSL